METQAGEEQQWDADPALEFGSLPGGSWARLPIALQKRWQLGTDAAWVRRCQRLVYELLCFRKRV